MNQVKQIFQTESRLRWTAFKWTTRIGIALFILMIPVVIITLARGISPNLPLLTSDEIAGKHLSNPVTPIGLSSRELLRYKGFNDYLNTTIASKSKKCTSDSLARSSSVRAAFYVDWDPQSFYSLQKNIGQLNMVIPEWFFIDPDTDTLQLHIDPVALDLMKKNAVRIVPILNNINERKGEGEFDGALLHRVLHDRIKRTRLINDIAKYLQQYGLQGINVDFEEFREKGDEPMIAFQKELYEKLHPLGLMVTQDVMAYNDDFNVPALAPYEDYLFLMAYDEHYGTSVPGAISSQRWVEKVLDETAKEISSSKIILCLAGYGYDWPDQEEASTLTYEQAIATAKLNQSTIDFNNDDYNNSFSYNDADHIHHNVYFTDAASNFNIMRFAEEYGTAGTALWRLGSEDQRIWKFYSRNLSNAGLALHPFDFNSLRHVNNPFEKPDYVGDGEILNVISEPEPGNIQLEIDTAEAVISEQVYLQLPTKYVIKKYGNVHNQVILSFDDGPDPRYTPQVLDILKKEKVPASFFIVGIEAENNLPLLKRIYREGHEIGNHTFTHPNIAAVSPERALAEMESTRLLIEAVTGRSTILFRAPYNADAEPTNEVELRPVALGKKNNYYSVGESIDPNDWEPGVTADSVYYRTIRQYEANPEKGIILLHDAGGNRQATVDALPRIIHYFKNKGVGFTTIAHLLHTNKDVIMPPVHSPLVQLDNGIATCWYWIGLFISTAFWAAILLGLGRTIIMAALATIGKLKERKRKRPLPETTNEQPGVSIIVPAYNEEMNAAKTIRNLLQQDYPNFDIIFVDDGSSDATYSRIKEEFRGDERVTVLTKANGGKASALNFGILHTRNAFVVCVDADTQLQPDAVSQLLSRMMADKRVGAVAGYVMVGNQRTLLTRWQGIEYTTAQNFDRRAFDLINGITVVPGAIGAFSKEAIEQAGGFTSDTLAEDCDLTIRILRAGYRVTNCNDAIAVTEAPETLRQFMKQRFRWTYGIMQSFWKNKDACFNPAYKTLGMVALPHMLLFQIILPLLSPLADLMLVLSLVWNHHDPQSLHKIELYYVIFLGVDLLVSAIAFSFGKERLSKLFWLLPQRLVYRQLMYIILFKALRKAIKGESQGWGVLRRTGNVTAVINLPVE